MKLLLPFVILAAAGMGGSNAHAAGPARPPNIVLILADDLGWADVGCYGNTYNETPRIDRLAHEGIRFTQFYAGPVCSPTRANLQSGRDQARYGITQHIPGHRRPFAKLIDPVVPKQLPLDVVTFAERLRDAGYATGYFGKWHLGGDDFGPDKQGWQTAIEFTGNTTPSRLPQAASMPRAADFLADRAVAFIREHGSHPFLLQVSSSAVHIPLSTTPDRLAKFKTKPPMPGYPSLPDYAGLLEELDNCVGRIVDAIDEAGLGENTLVLFVSDNGGLVHQQGGAVVTSNAPLRGEKGTLYEGGIRVPAVARWTGRIPAGQTCVTPAITQDLYPTFLALAGVKPPPTGQLDGVSVAALLTDPSAGLEPRALYWHLPHYHHSTPAGAIRQGSWKLIEFFESGSIELYDIDRDPGEATNLAGREPQRAAALRERLHEWQTAVGARMPVLNPHYDPARATQLGKGTSRGGKASPEHEP
ncbi:MAG: sulfatase [Opitutaceae bacterium]|nr:sulfatase [Opitutaceae bacterium]